MLIKLFVLYLSLVISLDVTRAGTLPATERRLTGVPKLSDTLSVAKSPLEPMTLAPNLPDGRNNEPALTGQPELDNGSVTTTTGNVEETNKQATTTTTTLGSDDEDTAASGDGEKSSTEMSTLKTETPVAELETENGTNNDASEPTITTSTWEPTKIITTTTTTSTTEAAVVSSSQATEESTSVRDTSPESFPKLEGSEGDGNFKGASSLGQNISIEIEPPSSSTTTETMPETTSAPESSSPKVPQDFDKETGPILSETPTTTTTSAPTTSELEATTTTAEPSSTTSASTTTSTTAAAPAVAAAETLSPTTTTTSTPTPAPATSTDADQNKNDEQQARCNHLPSYRSDEVQKVFREETTYRNGTIKGKFTYINFDQRYRLVHYTRLPYGPVKIDLVEELGKPDQEARGEGNRSDLAPSSPNDIPDAVLHMRNLLPTSLFGFPFLGPSSIMANSNGGQLGPRRDQNNLASTNSNEDRSNMYFYSTDSLATPNLLSQRVPVSLLPGQRLDQSASSFPSADSLARSYLEHSSLSSFARPHHQYQAILSSNSAEQLANQNQQQEALRQHQRQLHYSYPEQPLKQHSNYDYYATHQPLPILHSPMSGQLFNLEQQPKVLTHQQYQIQHQPHAHEHNLAPFMFNSPSTTGGIGDLSRLRIRVKSSKALQNPAENAGTKSAQLRLHSSGLYAPPANNPAVRSSNQPNKSRQRLGKQNNQLRATDSLPVVYHVLRNPAGRTYATTNHQAYAIAYDHQD